MTREEFSEYMVSPVNDLLRDLNTLVFRDNVDIGKLGLAVGLITDFVWEHALASHAPSEAATPQQSADCSAEIEHNDH